MEQPFRTSLEHLLAELERVDFVIRLALWRAEQVKEGDRRFEGLCITDDEVHALAAGPTGMPLWARQPSAWSEPDVAAAFERMTDVIAARRAASATHGLDLRLEHIASLFGLEPFDVDVLVACVAPELDLRYERMFAYLQDDVTRRRPSVDLVLNLLCPSVEVKLARLSRLSHTAPLVRHQLLDLFEDPARPMSPLLGKHLKVDERIVRYLLGSDDIDGALAPFVRRVPRGAHAHAATGRDMEARIDLLGEAFRPREGLLVHLQGPAGVGRKAWAGAACARLDLALLVVDGDKLVGAKDADFERLARAACREASLQRAALYWQGFDALLSPERRPQREALVDEIVARRGLSFVAGSAAWEPIETRGRITFLGLELPRPSHAERLSMWTQALGPGVPGATFDALPEVATKFRFTSAEIHAAAEGARSRARWRGPGADAVIPDDLYAGCRARSNKKIGELARKIEPLYRWRDIVLSPEAIQQLREICATARLRARVHEEWGWAEKLSSGKGLNAVFCGPSGTGKTMAAEILAAELGLDLYKVDLSGVVSKWVGETEKNLARIFAEAETSNAILFFDEADALFGKRSETKDAQDRYANIETSYLLQRMEEYEGITILATNLRRNMDDAFARRLAFSVTFPFPDEQERLRIWRAVWPSATPRGSDLDLGFMARQFKLSGGNIKNIALGATFLAAEVTTEVSMAHLVRATKRELQKMGKTCVPSEFGPYAGWLEGTATLNGPSVG